MKKLLNLLFLFATVAFMGVSEGKANPPPDYDDMVCAEFSCTVQAVAQDHHQSALLFESPSIMGNLTEDRSTKPFDSTCAVELFEPPRWLSGDSKCRLCLTWGESNWYNNNDGNLISAPTYYPPSDSKARRCGKNQTIFKNPKAYPLHLSA